MLEGSLLLSQSGQALRTDHVSIAPSWPETTLSLILSDDKLVLFALT